MNFKLLIAIVVVLMWTNIGALRPKAATSRRSHFRLLDSSAGDWFNERLSVDDIQAMWKSSGAPMKAFGEKGQGRALMTVGAKGIGPNTINSLAELLKQHETVRVKVASTNIDTMKLSNDMCSSEQLKDSVEVLAVKQREFMVARKGAKAVKPVKA